MKMTKERGFSYTEKEKECDLQYIIVNYSFLSFGLQPPFLLLKKKGDIL